MLDIAAVVLVLAAGAAWLNRKLFRLPPTIGGPNKIPSARRKSVSPLV